MSAKRHASFLINTLAPDFRRSGQLEMAKDISRCGQLMQRGASDARFARWLKSTLIPDLRTSGQPQTAKDLARCARAITPRRGR